MATDEELSALRADSAALTKLLAELNERLRAAETAMAAGSSDELATPPLAKGTAENGAHASVALVRAQRQSITMFKCVRCKAENAPDASFCSRCGSALAGDLTLLPLPQRILDACRTRALEPAQIARVLNVDEGSVDEPIRALAEAERLCNIGTDKRPRWFTRVGDEAPQEVLLASIKYLIGDAPRTLQDLIEITGARRSRVTGARIQLVRNGEKVINLGSGKIARWFLVPKGAAR